MSLSARTKIIVIAVGILVIAVAAVTATSSYLFTKIYSGALISQATVLAQSLKQQLDRLLRLGIAIDELVGFEKQCQEIVSRNEGIISAMVLNPEGKIIFHNDPAQQGKVMTDQETQNALKHGREFIETSLSAGDDVYDIFLPVFDKYSEYVAMVRVSFPAKVVSQKTYIIVQYSLLIAVGCLLMAALLLVVVLNISVNRPLARLVAAILNIRKRGTDSYQHVQIESAAEFGQLGVAFNEMIDDLNRTHDELRNYTQELESRVKERTTQLEDANDQLQRDIVERRRVEMSLRESEERLQAITRSAMDAVVLVDEQGVISYWNPAATRMFGFDRQEAMGRQAQTLLVPEEYVADFNSALTRLQTVGQGVNGQKTLEGTALRKGGNRFPVEYSVSPTKIRDQWYVTGIIRDISERRRLEDELARVRKFESIGVLAGGLAHDFNNLLAIIMGNISVAQTYLDSSQKSYQLLMNAENASFQARDLIQQLIAVSRGAAPSKRDMDLGGLIRDAVAFTLTNSQVTCDLALQQDLWPASCDSNQIRQVIAQLVLNACEATPDGGKIEVEAKNVELDLGSMASLPAGRYLRISVVDHGQGVQPDILPRIFDPYVSGKQRGIQKGMGLGLTIAYAIVKKHGGHIEVQSVPGQGAILRVYLPAAQTPAAGETEPANT
jgi:PAS domain S-box-containing protein